VVSARAGLDGCVGIGYVEYRDDRKLPSGAYMVRTFERALSVCKHLAAKPISYFT